MEWLEITVKSATSLKDLSTIGTMEPYVIVALSTNPKSVQKTELAFTGGTNPKWQIKPMRFPVNEDTCKKQNVLLVFKIMAKKAFDDKEVGNVVILVRELFGQVPQMNEKSLSCIVSTPSGRPKGTLHFVYKFVKNATRNVETVRKPNVAEVYASQKAVGSMTSNYGSNMYPSIEAIGSVTSSYKTDLYPHLQKEIDVPKASPPRQDTQTAGYYYEPPQQGYPHLQGYVQPPPQPSPLPQGYPHQQGYAQPPPPPPPQYQQQPVEYYPPHQQGYPPPQPEPYAHYHQNASSPYAPGPSNASASGSRTVQVREVAGKKPKSKKGGGWLAALGTGAAGIVGTMLLGPEVGSSLVELATSGLEGAGDYGGMHHGAAAGRYYNFNNVFDGHFDSIGSAIG